MLAYENSDPKELIQSAVVFPLSIDGELKQRLSAGSKRQHQFPSSSVSSQLYVVERSADTVNLPG